MRNRLLYLLVLCFGSVAVAADVYRWKDADGNVIFSDTPREGAEKIELKETTIVPALKTPPQRRTERRSPASSKTGYESIRIASPSHEETLRNVQGITVTVALEPALRTQQGDQIQLYVDGAAYGEPQSGTSFTLSETNRGEHQLAAAVLDKSGQELKRSGTSVFYLHRQSVQHPAPANPATN